MPATRLIQVTNISPAISEEQMLTLFGFVGKIEAMCMYPSVQALESAPDTPKICYIKFFDATCVGVSQYLTNTVFNDRALVVTPVEDGQIPDEDKAKDMAAQVGLPPAVNKPLDKPKSEIVNLLEGTPPNQFIVSHDPRLEELGLPKYPPLPATFEGPVIEEIRRTVLIININEEVSSEELIQCFEKAGDIKYMKFCSRSDNIRYALIEFTEQQHVIEALQMNGFKLKGKVMKVYHSTQAITKPETKSNEVAQREVVEALTRVKEAESLILAAIDPLLSLGKSKKGRSRSKTPRRSRQRRSRSRSRRRSRSRSHSHRRRANSRTRRSRSKSHHRKPKSKSPRRHRKSRSKSPTRTQRKSRSRSPRTKRKSRSKSPRTKRKSRSKSPSRPKRKSRSKSPARTKKRSRSKSPSKSKRKSRSRSPRSRRKSRSRSPRSKHRSSPKSKPVSSKSNLSREKSKNADKSPEKRSKSENDKRDRDKEKADKNRGKRETKRDKKDGESRSRKHDKEHDDRKSKSRSKLKDMEDHKNVQENGNYSSQTEGASEEMSHADKTNLVKENGTLESYESDVSIQNDHNSEVTASFNQTVKYNKNTESFGVADNLGTYSLEDNISVLKGPNKDFKSEGLDLKEDSDVFRSDLQCDSLAVDTSPKQNIESFCTENSLSVEVLETSRSPSHFHSESVSCHCPPNLADCDTRSCSPVEPL